MIDFNKVELDVNINEILSKVTELEIFHKYINNFIQLDKSFCSELRIDSNPGCRVYLSNSGYRFKDFATSDNLSCWQYVMKKFNCNYYESLNIIANDFNIKKLQIKYSPELLGDEPRKSVDIKIKQKTIIEINPQSWNIVDYNYWSKYNISFDILNEYNVKSLKNYTLYKGNNRYKIESSKNSPIYSYAFYRDGEINYKIYRPMEKFGSAKWCFNGGKQDLEGYDQLNLHGDIIILGKSMKDVMVYKSIGIEAFAMQGEKNIPTKDLIDKVYKRFNKIIVNLDNDPTGVECTNEICKLYNIDSFYIDGAKDLSDLVLDKGIDYAKEQINNKINNICIKQ